MPAITQLTVVQGEYVVPIEEVDAHREAHLAFVAGLVEAGRVLLAGRRTPPDGSVLVVRGGDEAAAVAMLDDDPYVAAGVVRYEATAVFTPGRHAPELVALLAEG